MKTGESGEQEKTEQPEPIEVVPQPCLMWTCPHDGCGTQGAIIGLQHIQGLMIGAKIRIQCGKCGGDTVLRRPEQPRVVAAESVTSPIPNRMARRASSAMQRKSNGKLIIP